VHPDWALSAGSGSGIGIMLVEKIQEIARHIKGVTSVQLPYRRGAFIRLDRSQ
jgi:hypothetical protein